MLSLLDDKFGWVNGVLQSLGLPSVPWIRSTAFSKISVETVIVWRNLGYFLVIFLAGLQSIDRELYEAAAIDGAGPVQTFRSITLPLLRPITVFVLIITSNLVLNMFEVVFGMTQGGPQYSAQSVIVAALFSPFAVFFVRQDIAAALPDELMQAAQIDGCSFFGIYRRICRPIIPPGLAAIGILTFVGSWNAFMWPLLMLDQPSMMTIPVGLTALKAGAAMDPKFYEGLIAGTALGTLPLVAAFVACQRFFVAGLTSGAFKGGVQ